MAGDAHDRDCMRYMDDEMNAEERARFERHLSTCETCRKFCHDMSLLKEVTDTMKVADLPKTVWDGYWDRIYNRIERSVAWFLFVTGLVMLTGYWLYLAVTDPGLRSFLGLSLVLTLGGGAVLFLSVLREKLTINKSDRYIHEVKR